MTIEKDQPPKNDARPPDRAFGDTLRVTEGDRTFSLAACALRPTVSGITADLKNSGR